MKKSLFWMIAAAIAVVNTSCDGTKENEGPVIDPVEKFVILTFEDADYKGGAGSYWSLLIDSPEYGGSLLYGSDPTDWNGVVEYEWTDEGNTWLRGGTFVDSGFSFSFGGAAVSNYVLEDETQADYKRQLSLWTSRPQGKGGHNDSANFCVVFTGIGLGLLPAITFADGKEHVIDHMYVANIAYTANSLLNIESEKAGDDDWFCVTATGYDLAENETGEVTINLFADGEIVRDWTKWDLSPLGRVSSVKFECTGSVQNTYGLATPTYFAMDDIAVRTEEE